MKRVPAVLAGILLIAALASCAAPSAAAPTPTPPEATPTAGTAAPTAPGSPTSLASIYAGRESHVLGTWWWNADLIRKAADRKIRLDFLQANGVTEIYLSFGGVVWDSQYRDFIADCTARGIRVSALDGDAAWLNAEGYAAYERWLAHVAAYQEAAVEGERFYGIHLDLEPLQNAEYAADPASMATDVARIYDRARAFCDAQDLEFAADVSLWLDDPALGTPDPQDPVTLGEYIARRVDTLALMAYRDTAARQFADAQPMLRIAQRTGKAVVVGSETGKVDEPEFVTYYEEGKAALVDQMGKLQILMDGTGLRYGLAIHYVESWFDLKD